LENFEERSSFVSKYISWKLEEKNFQAKNCENISTRRSDASAKITTALCFIG
jgi:hypothetical protein